MKFLIAIAALATLLMPTHAALRQCAGTGSDGKYEGTGYLTADWTQAACTASGGSIDPNKKGNLKCCNVLDARQDDFNKSCKVQVGGKKFPDSHPTPQAC
ncbi:hypothetical protein PHMEG_0008731 [Phytophthora megakarya]|uniref:Uncharacterized protein n=1 Tax=Phytophthora megakarya TaxID=4795 RepID=A0A225WK04_9STRA|nr:hypothetical protein PHMEG_0008731 [Phytophthora megakarya]